MSPIGRVDDRSRRGLELSGAVLGKNGDGFEGDLIGEHLERSESGQTLRGGVEVCGVDTDFIDGGGDRGDEAWDRIEQPLTGFAETLTVGFEAGDLDLSRRQTPIDRAWFGH